MAFCLSVGQEGISKGLGFENAMGDENSYLGFGDLGFEDLVVRA